jgi:hypothetical protein
MHPATRISSPIIFCAAMVLAGTFRVAAGEVLIHEDFEAVDEGLVPDKGRPIGTLLKWEGNEQPMLGTVGVAANPSDGGGKALRVTDSSPAESMSPSVRANWTSPAAGALVVEWKLLVPVEGTYVSPAYLGGGWDDAAAILIVENGEITVQYGGKAARLKIGKYKPNTWHTVRFELDLTSRKFHFYLDGTKRANGLSFQTENKKVEFLEIFADYAPVERNGSPVLYLDDITVETLAEMPTGVKPAAK